LAVTFPVTLKKVQPSLVSSEIMFFQLPCYLIPKLPSMMRQTYNHSAETGVSGE
jgi:hypothetical protein